MANPVLNGSANAAGGATTIAFSPTSNILVGGGKLLIFVLCTDNTAPQAVTCADNSSQAGTANTYTQRVAQLAIGTNNASVWLFECDVTRQIQTTDTITATFGTSSEFNRTIYGVIDSNLVAGNSFDVSASSGHANTSLIGGGSATPTTGNSVAYAVGADHTSSSTGETPSAGYTELAKQTYNAGDLTFITYKIVTGTSAEAPSETLTGGTYTANDNGGVTIILKASAPASPLFTAVQMHVRGGR